MTPRIRCVALPCVVPAYAVALQGVEARLLSLDTGPWTLAPKGTRHSSLIAGPWRGTPITQPRNQR
jgi:hypothetical protein